MMIEPGIERRKIERDTVYFTDNIGNPDYDTCVYWTVELNQHLNFAWHNRFIEGGKIASKLKGHKLFIIFSQFFMLTYIKN